MLTRCLLRHWLSPVLLLYFVLQELPLWFLPLSVLPQELPPEHYETFRHRPGQGNEQCFNSVFHTVFSLFVNSGITLTAVKTVNKWQCSEMEKAAKATFSCYSCKAFFARRLQDYCCSSASPILIFASLRRLLIRASKTICALFWVIPCTIAFSDLPALNLVSLHPAPAEPHYLAYRSPYRSSVCLSLAAAVQTQPG